MADLGYANYDEDEDALSDDESQEDDTLSPLDRFHKYRNSHLLLQRLRVVKDLTEISQHVGATTFTKEILPHLKAFADDKEGAVLQSFAEQLGHLCLFLVKNDPDTALSVTSETLLPLGNSLLVDDHHQVRAAAKDSLVMMASQLSEEQQSSQIVPIVSQMAKPTADEDHRIEAAELLNKLVPVLKGDLLKSFALQKIVALAKDPMFRVRKAVAFAMVAASEQLDQEAVDNEIIPIFLALVADEIWGVRKACAESIVPIASAASPEVRVQKLITVFEGLIKDSSRWVRNSSYQYLGPFIATLDKDTVSAQLLSHYTGMIEGTRSQFGDTDTVRYCAFSFPGVLLTLGREKWPSLQSIYSTLTQDLQWKVRRTLSHSLHEVAKILGTELAEAHLLPTFDLFLKDLDQVKVGVIRHLADFLAVLSPETRKEYIGPIREIQLHGANWRFRKLLAKQLGKLASLYDITVVTSTIIPMAVQLCEDQVTTVRYAVTSELGVLLKHLKEQDPEVASDFIQTILPFSERTSCYDRQTFAIICESLVDHIDSKAFEEQFFPPLLRLSSDKVPNVRMIVARIFCNQLSTEAFVTIRDDVSGQLEVLRKDGDSDVRTQATLVA